MLPCLIFEDEHLLAVNKPAGLNTHAPAPFAGEGLYDWLRHREPRWSRLAIVHRLDKETSGALVFGKTAAANRSLTEQFTRRAVRKKYLLLTDRAAPRREFVVRSKIVRAGERYASGAVGEPAETMFRPAPLKFQIRNFQFIEAEPLTGRTHQIRVHAAENGFPILGDALYGGSPFARVCLHAAELALRHPVSGDELLFRAPVDFARDPRLGLRAALIEPAETDAFRLVHGASDGWTGWQLERLGEFLLSQSEHPLAGAQRDFLRQFPARGTVPENRSEPRPERGAALAFASGVYHKILTRQVRRTSPTAASPQLALGAPAPDRFTILENGLRFELSFSEGYSCGLFLDQRDNRRRLLTGHVAAGFPLFEVTPKSRNSKIEVLNTFAYTCAFSVCAAKSGARTVSVDLSKKYLDWGRRNFALNRLDAAAHDFIFGDTFDWLRRLAKKERRFDLILLDPPTFSQSKEHGVFRAERDMGRLVLASLPLLKPGGVLLASSNAATWRPEDFLANVEAAIRAGQREILQRHFAPQPPDFPVSRTEPAYLKTVWLRLG